MPHEIKINTGLLIWLGLMGFMVFLVLIMFAIGPEDED